MANMNSRSQFELNDDNNFETFNFRLENRTSDPAGGMLGSAYFNTVLGCVRVKDAVGWQNYFSAAKSPLPYLYNCRPLQFQTRNVGGGIWTIGNVPAGKKWMVVGSWYSNTTGGSIQVTPSFVYSLTGSIVRFATPLLVLASSVGSHPSTCPILTEGDSLQYSFDVGGLDLNIQVWEFDSTSPIRTSYLDSLYFLEVNTVYTCPAGIKAYPISFTLGVPTLGTLGASFIYSCGVATTRLVYANLVKSGGSPVAPGSGASCLTPTSISVPPQTTQPVLNTPCPASFESGDFLTLNINGGSPLLQRAWLTVLEL